MNTTTATMTTSAAGVQSTYGALVTNALGRRTAGTAFIAADDTEISFPEALDLFGRLRTALRAAGVTHGKGFGLLSANRPDGWLAQWAGVANGGRVTPLHPFGSFDDHFFIAQDADLTVIIVDCADHRERGRQLAEAMPNTIFLTLDDADFGTNLLRLAADAEPDIAIDTAVTSDDTAMVIYTGGTTGRSKGVILPHRAIVANHLLQLADWPWPSEPRFLVTAPMSHATGWFPLGALWFGGTVIMRRRFEINAFLSAVSKHKVNMTFCVPSMVYSLLDDPSTAETDLSSLELLVYGGAPMTVPRLIKGLELFGPIFLQLYGQSEMPNVVTTLLPSEHDPTRPDRLASCGRPSAGITLRLLDDNGDEVPPGTVGELSVRGPLVMDGYRNLPEETAKALKDGWLRSGDLAVQNTDGFITLVSRAKDVIISGGFNVYPAEVEGPLLTHPAVAAAAVVGLPDDKWGEAVTAFVVLHEGAVVDGADLMALVKKRKGPIYTPKSVHFIEAVPLTSLGKPDKKALRVPSVRG
ncbi:fatty-acyl-CoA synthase [Cryobacterium flavum]|uniref:Acyl-CoA synthetase n=1 Tax=Cryobacterium flavum TaxID=1424659 RepID=A0A4R8UX82_9MICO|nr:AMP-binding protein [Cryobacterium flavum]TFB73620.1 acyl-CoA synthetase [Cryobacterium flavum]SDO32425.1 fatty-acyl-CoA synthase [Cryobacterium flavum]